MIQPAASRALPPTLGVVPVIAPNPRVWPGAKADELRVAPDGLPARVVKAPNAHKADLIKRYSHTVARAMGVPDGFRDRRTETSPPEPAAGHFCAFSTTGGQTQCVFRQDDARLVTRYCARCTNREFAQRDGRGLRAAPAPAAKIVTPP